MAGDINNYKRNARVFKALSLLFLVLIGASMVLVHQASYEPAVSYIALYLTVSVGVAAAIALMLLSQKQFSESFSHLLYALFSALLAVLVFFTGGVSSELYSLYFLLIIASALHGRMRIAAFAQGAGLISYTLAMLPGMLNDTSAPPLVLYRLVVFFVVGVFASLMVRGKEEAAQEEPFTVDPDGSVLLEKVSGELSERRGAPVGLILADPGLETEEDLELLLERVGQRIGEPVLVGEGSVFGVVLSGVDDQAVESAARRALAAASSLGAVETRAGAALYPQDARTPPELLSAAGRALEAAFDVESPSAIVLAGEAAESRYRAAP